MHRIGHICAAMILMDDEDLSQKRCLDPEALFILDHMCKMIINKYPTLSAQTIDYTELENTMTDLWVQSQKYETIRREVDETKAIIHDTIKSFYDRGEALQDLDYKSSRLSENSTLFYQQVGSYFD
jgi:hypothetical protein